MDNSYKIITSCLAIKYIFLSNLWLTQLCHFGIKAWEKISDVFSASKKKTWRYPSVRLKKKNSAPPIFLSFSHFLRQWKKKKTLLAKKKSFSSEKNNCAVKLLRGSSFPAEKPGRQVPTRKKTRRDKKDFKDLQCTVCIGSPSQGSEHPRMFRRHFAEATFLSTLRYKPVSEPVCKNLKRV